MIEGRMKERKIFPMASGIVNSVMKLFFFAQVKGGRGGGEREGRKINKNSRNN